MSALERFVVSLLEDASEPFLKALAAKVAATATTLSDEAIDAITAKVAKKLGVSTPAQ